MIRSYYNKKLPDMTREQFKANMCGYLNCMIELEKKKLTIWNMLKLLDIFQHERS